MHTSDAKLNYNIIILWLRPRLTVDRLNNFMKTQMIKMHMKIKTKNCWHVALSA